MFFCFQRRIFFSCWWTVVPQIRLHMYTRVYWTYGLVYQHRRLSSCVEHDLFISRRQDWKSNLIGNILIYPFCFLQTCSCRNLFLLFSSGLSHTSSTPIETLSICVHARTNDGSSVSIVRLIEKLMKQIFSSNHHHLLFALLIQWDRWDTNNTLYIQHHLQSPLNCIPSVFRMAK